MNKTTTASADPSQTHSLRLIKQRGLRCGDIKFPVQSLLVGQPIKQGFLQAVHSDEWAREEYYLAQPWSETLTCIRYMINRISGRIQKCGTWFRFNSYTEPPNQPFSSKADNTSKSYQHTRSKKHSKSSWCRYDLQFHSDSIKTAMLPIPSRENVSQQFNIRSQRTLLGILVNPEFLFRCASQRCVQVAEDSVSNGGRILEINWLCIVIHSIWKSILLARIFITNKNELIRMFALVNFMIFTYYFTRFASYPRV